MNVHLVHHSALLSVKESQGGGGMRNHTIRCHFYKSPHSSLWFGYCCYTFARIVISCLSTVKTPLVASLLICIETDRKKAEATFSFERADLYGPIGFGIGNKKVEKYLLNTIQW